MHHIAYTLPTVTLLQESGLGVAEIAARTCYDSFENSENACIRQAKEHIDTDAVNAIETSELLAQLAWVHHHHSIIEHAVLSYLVKGTSRGVLQEHARHRIQAISVRSTRYTMSSVINAFIAALEADDPKAFFIRKVDALDMLVIADKAYRAIEIGAMFDKLAYQYDAMGRDTFIETSVAKSSLPLLETHKNDAQALYEALECGKKKRNVGDAFKHIVTDNWKVDMVVTFNIRSLKNYFDLRDSGAAWFQIRWLAQEMKRVTPEKYLRLIDKAYKTV
jgi:thymidylate synthase (FAD)